MREYHFKLEKELLHGIKRSPYLKVNSFEKEDCLNFIVDDGALVAFPFDELDGKDTMFNEFSMFKRYGISYDGFMPQIFQGELITLLNYYGLLYEVDIFNNALIPLKVDKDLWSKSPYTFVDKGHIWYLINKHHTIECVDGVLTEYKVGINTGLVIDERIVFGGFHPSAYLNPKSMFFPLDETSIWVSSIGGSFISQQFKQDIEDLSYLNRLDLIYATVEGVVQKIVMFMNGFLIATTKALYMARIIIDPIITLSINKIYSKGIKDECIAVLKEQVFFITTSNNLVTFDGRVFKDLNYSYLFSQYENLYMLVDENKDYILICDGKKGFVLYQQELYPLSKSISAIITI